MKRKPDERALLCDELYRALISALRYRAYRSGYAIAVHGSLKRDIDLIAAPWRDHPTTPAGLIEGLKGVAEAVVGFARVRDVDADQPVKKPCGRLAWSFYLTHEDNGPYLDISVMPVGKDYE